jgi:hypothetical protein
VSRTVQRMCSSSARRASSRRSTRRSSGLERALSILGRRTRLLSRPSHPARWTSRESLVHVTRLAC